MTDGRLTCALLCLPQTAPNVGNWSSISAEAPPDLPLALFEVLTDRAEIAFRDRVVDAFGDLVEGIEQYLCVAQLGERTGNITDETVLASVTLLTYRFPQQAQSRSSALQ